MAARRLRVCVREYCVDCVRAAKAAASARSERVAYLDGRVAVFEVEAPCWAFVTATDKIPRQPTRFPDRIQTQLSLLHLAFSAGVKRLTAIRSTAASTPAVLILRPIAKSLIGRVRVPLRDPLPNQPS